MSNRVAIVGATGLVGQALLRILEERSFPIEKLIPLASERSAGQNIRFNGQDHEIQTLDDFDFENIDIDSLKNIRDILFKNEMHQRKTQILNYN